MEIKGGDGTATLTDTHVVFEFKKRLHSFKGTDRVEIPVESITNVEYFPATLTRRESIRVRADGVPSSGDQMKDPCTIFLGSKRDGKAFADEVIARSNATRGGVEQIVAREKADELAARDAAAQERSAEKAAVAADRAEAREIAAQAKQERKSVAAEVRRERRREVASMPQSFFETYTVKAGVLHHLGQQWDIRGASASIDLGAPKKGLTATRVVMLGVFSLAAKKEKTKLFITVELADGRVLVIDGPAKREMQARQFVAAINSSR